MMRLNDTAVDIMEMCRYYNIYSLSVWFPPAADTSTQRLYAVSARQLSRNVAPAVTDTRAWLTRTWRGSKYFLG